MTSPFAYEIACLIPSIDNASFLVTLASATGFVADGTIVAPQKIYNSTTYYVYHLRLTSGARDSVKTFLDANSTRLYAERALVSATVQHTSTGETALIGRYLNFDRFYDQLQIITTSVGTKLSDIWTVWKTDYVTTSGTWTYKYPSYAQRTISTSNGWVYNPSVQRGGSSTPGFLSEGQSFGLYKAVLQNDQTTFNNIWFRSKFNLRVRSDKLFYFAYYIDTSQPSWAAIATDGDVGICHAMLLAHEKGWTGDSFRTLALETLASIRAKCVVSLSNGRKILAGGALGDANNWVADPTLGTFVFTNYLMVAAFYKFAQHDTSYASVWNQLITDSLYYVNQAKTLHSWPLSPEGFRVRNDGTIAISDVTSRRFHYYGTGRFYWQVAWLASLGHPEAIAFLRAEKAYLNEYRNNNLVPWSWNADGSIIRTSNSPAGMAELAAIVSVDNPTLAGTLLNRVNTEAYNATTKKFLFNEDSYFMQSCIWFAYAVAGKKIA